MLLVALASHSAGTPAHSKAQRGSAQHVLTTGGRQAQQVLQPVNVVGPVGDRWHQLAQGHPPAQCGVGWGRWSAARKPVDVVGPVGDRWHQLAQRHPPAQCGVGWGRWGARK